MILQTEEEISKFVEFLDSVRKEKEIYGKLSRRKTFEGTYF